MSVLHAGMCWTDDDDDDDDDEKCGIYELYMYMNYFCWDSVY